MLDLRCCQVEMALLQQQSAKEAERRWASLTEGERSVELAVSEDEAARKFGMEKAYLSVERQQLLRAVWVGRGEVGEAVPEEKAHIALPRGALFDMVACLVYVRRRPSNARPNAGGSG